MKNTFDKGIAFICEGDTEKEFYLSLLCFLCEKHGAQMERRKDEDEPDVVYEIRQGERIFYVKFYVANAVSGLPKSGKWFEAECLRKYAGKHEWTVFLCYDMDDYKGDITPFYEGDWKELRKKLGKAKQVIDLAAAADMEDLLLTDIEGICTYLECPPVEPAALHGRKGSAKMKVLFRISGKSYHKGTRARAMIDHLDKQKIMDSGILPLDSLESLFVR